MAVYFNEETKTFYLEGKNISYIFGINFTGFPEHYYFGARIGRDELAYTYESGASSEERRLILKTGFSIEHGSLRYPVSTLSAVPVGSLVLFSLFRKLV